MFLSLIHDYHVGIFNSPELRVRVEKHLFLETSRDCIRLREVSANPAVENKRSHMFEVGTMKRKSIYFDSVLFDTLRRFKACSVRVSCSRSAGAS